jgi:predicted amidophosphoribosyltransferase
MDPVLYFSFFIGALVLFLIVSIMHKPATRPCPACGAPTPLQARRCRHCGYMFSRV